MDYFDTLHARKSVRGFLKDVLIPEDILEKIFLAAGRSASSKNVQPWLVYLLQGPSLEGFRADFSQAFDEKALSNRPFQTYPQPLPEEWNQRAHDLGAKVYAQKGIDRQDLEGRRQHARQNFIFFEAPQVLYLVTRRDAEKGTLLDLGMFLGSVLNGLVAAGYAGVPMFTGITYTDIVIKHLKLTEDLMPVCAVAIGKESQAIINSLHTDRRPLAEWFKIL